MCKQEPFSYQSQPKIFIEVEIKLRSRLRPKIPGGIDDEWTTETRKIALEATKGHCDITQNKYAHICP